MYGSAVLTQWTEITLPRNFVFEQQLERTYLGCKVFSRLPFRLLCN
jgi:hypothetical protein